MNSSGLSKGKSNVKRVPGYRTLAVEMNTMEIESNELLNEFHSRLLEDEIAVELNDGRDSNLICMYNKPQNDISDFFSSKPKSKVKQEKPKSKGIKNCQSKSMSEIPRLSDIAEDPEIEVGRSNSPEDKIGVYLPKSSNISALLEKYSYKPKVCVNKFSSNSDYKLRTAILYIDTQSSKSLDNLETLKSLITQLSLKPCNKKLVLFNGIQNAISRRTYKMKLQLAQGNCEEIDSQVLPCTESCDDFEEFLIWIQIEAGLDYCSAQDNEETYEFLATCLAHSTDLPCKKELNPFTKKSKTHSIVSSLHFQIENPIQLMWLDMLMAIPGVSEDKAAAIVKEYPDMASLYKGYRGVEREKREYLLQDIPVAYNLSETVKKRLGPALSRKIFIVFNSLDPNVTI